MMKKLSSRRRRKKKTTTCLTNYLISSMTLQVVRSMEDVLP